MSDRNRETGGANVAEREKPAKRVMSEGVVGIGSVEIHFQPRTSQPELEQRHEGGKVGRTARRVVNISTPFR